MINLKGEINYGIFNFRRSKRFTAGRAEFCENEVKEQCKEFDRSGEWPKEIYDKAIEMQLHSLEVPEEYGGPGLSRVDVAALIEEMAIADAGFATTILPAGHGNKPV